MESIINIVKSITHRPTWEQYFMSVAYLISLRSSCSRLHVGCVIVKDNRIVSTGYNGHLPNTEHSSIIQDGHEQMTVHAETNAVTDAAKRGISLSGTIAYVTHLPCIVCAKILIASGIKHIIFSEHYNDNDLVFILCDSSNVQLSIFEANILTTIVI
jgi:dCMP deaminase